MNTELKKHINECIENAHLHSETQLDEVVDLIIEYLLETQDDAQTADDVGGQEGEYQGVIIADWNMVEDGWYQLLDSMGFAIYFPDEVIVCEQGKVWNIIPRFYGDMPKVKICDGYVITPDNAPSEWIEECEMTDYNQPIAALPGWFDVEHLVAAGYEKQNEEEYENGLHIGQDDDPAEIAKSLFDKGAESVIFHTHRAGQFDIQFSVWSK